MTQQKKLNVFRINNFALLQRDDVENNFLHTKMLGIVFLNYMSLYKRPIVCFDYFIFQTFMLKKCLSMQVHIAYSSHF